MKFLKTILSVVALIGVSVAMAASNDKCPISGKAVNPETAININGKEVAFCCKNCSASFQSKLNVQEKSEPGTCPISGKPALAENEILHVKTDAVYFCCEKCQAKYAKENKLTIQENATPGKCPLSGKEAVADKFVLHNGEKIFFCCGNCQANYVKKVAPTASAPDKCAVSGEPAKAETLMLVTKTEKVNFCCPNCPGAYTKKHFTAASK
jgi:YHS domain-containing protein